MTVTQPRTTEQRVADLARGLILPLQQGYARDAAHAVGSLARLRRGVGRNFAETPDLWGLVDVQPLHTAPADGGRSLREDEIVRAEDAVHVSLTLWALHQQSRGQSMHRANGPKSNMGLGAAVRRLMPPDEIKEPALKRLIRVGNAPDLRTLSQRLRDIVVLLRAADLPLDYALLAGQLYHWQNPSDRDIVRRAWGRSFHALRGREAVEPTVAPSADHHVNDDDKDAL